MTDDDEHRFSHEIALEPAFHDLDPMNVVWHGHYAKYFEIARCALLDRYDYNYPQMQASGYLWPVVDMRIKFVGSAVFGQKLTVRATITEWENRLRIDYVISDALDGRVLTKAHTIQVAVDMGTREMLFMSPAVLFEKLGVKP